MSTITASQVKTLREQTGAGMMDCKNALVECAGDGDAALKWLREKGIAQAEKRAGRVAAEGRVAARISDDGRVGALIEINCETDFVARNDEFGAFVDTLLAHVLAADPGSQEAFEASTLEATGKNVADSMTEFSGKIGEKLVARRYARVEAGPGCALGSYVHTLDHGTAVIAELKNVGDADATALAPILKDVAMQVTSMAPRFATDDDVDPVWRANELDVAMGKAREAGKPDNLLEKIATGMVQAQLKEVCLTAQKFVKESKQTVAKYVTEAGKAAGAPDLAVSRFVRFQRGEGLDAQGDVD